MRVAPWILFFCAMIFIVINYFWQNRVKRPPPVPPAQIATATLKIEVAYKDAVEKEIKAIEHRPKVKEATEAVEIATATRVISNFSIESLPESFATEFRALNQLIQAQAEQIELEIARGDAWRESFLAQQELLNMLTAHHEQQLKLSKRKGFAWGAGVGAGGILLLVILL